MALKLIQFGLGGWGRSWIAEVVREMPGIDAVAWVDPDPKSRALALTELALPPERVFASLKSALTQVEAQAALIVVPLAAHAAASKEAIAAGLDVLVEKPFAETLSQAADLIALAEKLGRKLMVSQNYRWFAAPRRARELLAGGALGASLACYLDFHFLFDQSYRYFDLAEPLLGDMAIHHFDAMRFVLGDEPVEVSCQSWSEPASPFHGRPAAIATIRFARGTMASYRGSWISRGPTTPYGGQWRIDGTSGTLEFRYRGALAARETMDSLLLYLPGRGGDPAALPSLPLQGPQRVPGGVRRLGDNGSGSRGAQHRGGQSPQSGLDGRGRPLGAERRRSGPNRGTSGRVGAMNEALRVTVWNEFRHERSNPQVAAVYPEGIHTALAVPLRRCGFSVRTATLDEPEHGLSDDVLAGTDVLLWWGHQAHDEVTDTVAQRVQQRVLGGMGLIVLHSGHFSKPFKRLMGTSCDLKWRVADERERLWLVAPGHPIAQGLPERIEIAREEMYGEHFDIPPPDELVFISWFQGGEVFRSGCCFRRGLGRIFYFRPGHETYPTYHDPLVQRVIGNAVRWAGPISGEAPRRGRSEALEPGV